MEYLDYFIEGEVKEVGDSLFDAIIRELRIIFRKEIFTIESLRQVCKNFAEGSDLPEWFTTGVAALRDHLDRTITLEDYKERITITSMSDPTGIRGLPRPIWGSLEVEGRIICQIYDVKLHVVKKHIINKGSASEQEVLTHTIIDKSDSRQVDEDEIDHHDKRIIHILDKGNLHFEPLIYKLENLEEHALNPYGSFADSKDFLNYDKVKRDKRRDYDREKVRQSIINRPFDENHNKALVEPVKVSNEEYDALSISEKQDLYFKDLCDFDGSPSHALPRLYEISNLLEKCNYKTVIDLIIQNKIDLKKISRQLVPIIHNYGSRRFSEDERSPGDLCAELYIYILYLPLAQRSESLIRDEILSLLLPDSKEKEPSAIAVKRSENLMIHKILLSLLPTNPNRPQESQEPSIIAAISGNLMLRNTKAFLELSKLLSWMVENGVLTKERIVEALSAKETDHHDNMQHMAREPLNFYERVKITCDYLDSDSKLLKEEGYALIRLQDITEFIQALIIFYRHGFISENSEDKDNRELVDILNKKIKEDNKELAKSSNQTYEVDATDKRVTQARVDLHTSQKRESKIKSNVTP